MAPMLLPELNRPVAKARSFFGNHSVMVFMAAGKLADSPAPSMKRAAARWKKLAAAACRHPAKLHTAMAMVYDMRVPNLSIKRPASYMPIAYAA